MDELLEFWLSNRAKWWTKSAAFDEEIRARFGVLRDEVASGRHEDWLATARGSLAYVVALDQFSRNLFRESGRAFEADPRALAAARAALDRGDDAQLAKDERVFLYMPFMHSEVIADQDRSIALFNALGIPNNLDFAEKHRAIIRRFGRFPHRNHVLGRTSTAEEIEFLKEPGSSF